MLSMGSDDYIDGNTPNEDLKALSDKTLAWHDKNNKNSFNTFKSFSIPNVALYFIVLFLSALLAFWIGQEIKEVIFNDIAPVIQQREDMIDDLMGPKK
jgi:hypothetical protein